MVFGALVVARAFRIFLVSSETTNYRWAGGKSASNEHKLSELSFVLIARNRGVEARPSPFSSRESRQ